MNAYFKDKKTMISKLTNNVITEFDVSNINIMFSNDYNSFDFVIFHDKKPLLKGTYEVIGYDNWVWGCDNQYIEKYLTNKSKMLKNKYNWKKTKKINERIDESKLVQMLFDLNGQWIIVNNINNVREYIVITNIYQIQ